MAPVALDPNNSVNGHDSFSLPATQEKMVHASARYTPKGGAFKVQADGTTYEEDGIRAKYVDRGSEVTREFHDGTLLPELMDRRYGWKVESDQD